MCDRSDLACDFRASRAPGVEDQGRIAGEETIMPKVDYIALARSLEKITSQARTATDRLRTLSYGTDASFYRLIPKIVVTVESEAEVIDVLAACAEFDAPVT